MRAAAEAVDLCENRAMTDPRQSGRRIGWHLHPWRLDTYRYWTGQRWLRDGEAAPEARPVVKRKQLLPWGSAILLPVLTLAVLGGIIGAVKIGTAIGPTANCTMAMEQAERQASDADYNADFYVERSLDMCRDADDWNKAFAKHPSLLGMTRATGDQDLEIACGVFPDTAVCESRR